MPLDPNTETIEFGDLADIPRPREQSRFVGHEVAEAAFLEAHHAGRLAHAWLIGGPHGIGKATFAYRIARWLCATTRDDRTLAVDPGRATARQIAALSHPNLVALRRVLGPGAKTLPTKISVDAARDALSIFASTAGADGYRICIIDSAEDLSASSANALLKMVEEPPPRSLFLIVSHAPGRLLPTIRSRCRMLKLNPLSQSEVREVIASFPSPFAQPEPDQAARAAALSDGSIARALTMLDPAAAALIDEARTLLERLPGPDWRRVTKLAETLSGKEGEARFALLIETVRSYLFDRIDQRQAMGIEGLARLVAASDRIDEEARQVATYNLDRRPFVLTAFSALDEALRPG